MPTIDIDEVVSWAREGGALAMRSFNTVTAQRKPDRSFVTAADVAVEQLLVERISARYPDHGIVGEELGEHGADREFVWLLDPIDGTGVFLAGLPTWGVSVGLVRNGKPYLGVINQPASNDCYWASEAGAFWNDQRIHVSQATAFDSNDWIALPSRGHLDYRIDFPAKMRALGSVAGHLCYVARGVCVGALLGGTGGGRLWDIAAGLAILQAAGGVTYRLRDGQPLDTVPMLAGARDTAPWLAAPPTLVAQLAATITPH